MLLPEFGQVVRVWPHPALARVPYAPGAFLSAGADVVFSLFLLERIRAGEVLLHDPNPVQAEPAPGTNSPEQPAPPTPVATPPVPQPAPGEVLP